MNENNQQEPSIDELIAQGENMSEKSERKIQTFFKKPVVIVVIILFTILILAYYLTILQPTQEKQEIEKQGIANELTKDRISTQPLNKEDVRKELVKPKDFVLTEEEKQSIRESLSQ